MDVAIEDFPAWINENSFYADTIKYYLNNAITKYIDNKNFDSAKILIGYIDVWAEVKKDNPLHFCLHSKLLVLRRSHLLYTIPPEVYQSSMVKSQLQPYAELH